MDRDNQCNSPLIQQARLYVCPEGGKLVAREIERNDYSIAALSQGEVCNAFRTWLLVEHMQRGLVLLIRRGALNKLSQ